jgi:hypothetical protein
VGRTNGSGSQFEGGQRVRRRLIGGFAFAFGLLSPLSLAATAGAGSTELVSVNSAGEPANGVATSPSLSADGRFVAFQSVASNLVVGDTNFTDDIFVRDRETGVTERVSVSSTGAQADQGCFEPAISADGRYVTFISPADNLVRAAEDPVPLRRLRARPADPRHDAGQREQRGRACE